MIIHSVPSWVELISLAACIGVLTCRLWVLSAHGEVPPDIGVMPALWRLFGCSVAAIIAASFADLLVRTVDMSGRPLAAALPALPVVLRRTHYGTVWLIRLATLAVITLAATAGRRYRNTTGFLVFMLAGTLIIAMTESASGHAADAGDFSKAEFMDLLHLLSASMWGGGLLALSMSILPQMINDTIAADSRVADVARRFSRLAGVAVGIVVITAAYNAWTYVDGISSLTGTAYGREVVAKTFLLLILLQLGGINRYVNVPLLQRGAGLSHGGGGFIGRIALHLYQRLSGMREYQTVAMRFKRSVCIEALLFASVLFLAAMLRHEIPARHQSHLSHMRGGTHSAPMNEHEGHSMSPSHDQ